MSFKSFDFLLSIILHFAISQITMPKMMSTSNIIPIIIFLFFHHILFFTFFAVSFKSYDWSVIISLFLTNTSIFSPLSITLSMFCREICSSSVSSFFNYDSLSTFVLSL